jgi:malonyl-CoA decarboxylase
MFGVGGARTTVTTRGGIKVAQLLRLCAKLLTERGQAVSTALAREALALYAELDRPQQVAFFKALLGTFSPDPRQVLQAAERYAAEPTAARLVELHRVAEPARQELLRRLNRVPGGTAAILRMREHLQQALREDPALAAVDGDFRHLLASWFNPGFLQIVRVDWRTPAELLERIITYEAVHAIQGWDDLRRRLEQDRRCFAFFHPALPGEPLIFVEVALVDAMPEAIGPLLDAQVARGDPKRARVAALYSINSCQRGLRNVSLGTFLVKQVVDLLATEFPRLRQFCTLSPIPGFATWVTAQLRQPEAGQPRALGRSLAAIVRTLGPDPVRVVSDPAAAERLQLVREPLLGLCATYLLTPGEPGAGTHDPVARFHLNNGARLERINWGADASKRGLHDSFGMMVNYVYAPETIEKNHDRFLNGRIAASRQVTSLTLVG